MVNQSQSSILLQGGTLLLHDNSNHVIPTIKDLLIEGSAISKIEKAIDPPEGAKVIECAGRIISPGFIDTHRHLFQTQMKGKHANHTLIEYMPPGSFVASFYTLEDTFWGQLSGALESIDAGTTTVVDHTSVNLSPDYPKTAVQALVTSGIRCIYCYAVARKVYSWSPFTVADESGTPWVMETFKALAAGGPYSNGRVEIGYANENVYMPAEVIKPFYQTLREAPAKLITTHSAAGPARGYPPPPSTLRILNKHSLLGPDILLSHANFPMDGDAELLVKSGAKVSSTPNTELQMAYPPVALEPEFYEHSSLGIDCHSWGTASIVTQMNQLLQWARCHHGENLAKEGKWSRHAVPDVEQVFNLGTIGGARAISMADQIGKLEVGMKADVLIFDGTSPAMLAAAEENPVAAIVLHSSTRDLETVIVDGVIRKEGGKLLDVHVADALEGQREVVELGPSLSWKDVVRGVLKSRESLNEKVKGIDMHAAEEVIIDAFRFDRSGMVE